MEKIERPKTISKSEASVQERGQLSKNLQSQIDKIYDKLDEIVDAINS